MYRMPSGFHRSPYKRYSKPTLMAFFMPMNREKPQKNKDYIPLGGGWAIVLGEYQYVGKEKKNGASDKKR